MVQLFAVIEAANNMFLERSAGKHAAGLPQGGHPGVRAETPGSMAEVNGRELMEAAASFKYKRYSLYVRGRSPTVRWRVLLMSLAIVYHVPPQWGVSGGLVNHLVSS